MPRLGVLSKFYVNSGTETTPIWEELPVISDCNVGGDWDEGEASARLSRAKASEPTMMGVEVTGKVRVKGSEAYLAYQLMREAWYKDKILSVLVLNGAFNEEGAEGFRFQAKVFGWSEDQSLGVVLYKDFSVKPCIPDFPVNAPKVAKVSLGVLTYSAFGLGA